MRAVFVVADEASIESGSIERRRHAATHWFPLLRQESQTSIIGERKLFMTKSRPRHALRARYVRSDGSSDPSPLTLLEASQLSVAEVSARLATRPEGLTSAEAERRLKKFGPNALAAGSGRSMVRLLWNSIVNPLVVLLATLATISFATGDVRAGGVMLAMILMGMALKLVQESRADRAAAKLKAMISLTATALRGGISSEVAVERLTPGDVIALAAGDMIPADVRLITAKDLFVSQGALTGESFPIEKIVEADSSQPPPGRDSVAGGGEAAELDLGNRRPLTTVNQALAQVSDGAAVGSQASALMEQTNIAFLGTSVESGSAMAIVVATGATTFLGQMSESLAVQPTMTAFDQGIAQFTKLMLRFILVMAPLVFVINGASKGDWAQAFFFAVAVAVGLTPEMLPMIVTVCLSKGAIAMSHQRVIVKQLNAIQNLGAMDVLCTDKTGTLTRDRVILERHCDAALEESDEVLKLAYLNSLFQTGLKNVLDRAVLEHREWRDSAEIASFQKVDEIPFDFERRVMSVVVRAPSGDDQMISKGAPEAILPRCRNFTLDGELLPMEQLLTDELRDEYEQLSRDGFRVLAIATKKMTPRDGCSSHTAYGKSDECDLTFQGYVAFLDPPKESAAAALGELAKLGVTVKVITGDNELVAQKICKEVGLSTERVLLGSALAKFNDAELADAARDVTLFARVSPFDKQRIIRALQSSHHTVGFLGDGINDAPALRAADVGISVDSAVDIAKESADLILLEKSLLVLAAGVVEGRKVFANILKYVRMGASSNFGNMLSVLGASVFVPFLPMAPIQILANNLLYDVSQTAIPTDDVDPDQLAKPRPWDMSQLTRFIVMIGPCSSLFDYTTYFVMLFVFDCWNRTTAEAAAQSEHLFQTGWFVESLLTQTLVIHVIRTRRIPWLQSRSSRLLMLTTIGVSAVGVALPYSDLGKGLGFVPLPALYWPIVAVSLLAYVGLTQYMKRWLVRTGID